MISQKIFIAVCQHKPAPQVKTQFLVPVHVGKALSSLNIEGTIGDNSGLNISAKNGSWCELTAMYWMRHNVDAEYYGLMHYRRLLDFSENGKGGSFEYINSSEYKKFGWDDERILAICSSYDIVTAPTCGVHPVGAAHIPMTNYEVYAHQHFSKDMDVVESIIKTHYPKIYPFMIQAMTSRSCFFGNITIMKKGLFNEYCDWLFDVIEKAEETIDISQYDFYQKRIWGFIAERLTNAYVAYAKAMHEAKVKELPSVFGVYPRPLIGRSELIQSTRLRLEKSAQEQKSASSSDQESINVVLAIDDKYAPHAAVTMLSAIRTTRVPSKLHFFIMHANNLSEDSKSKLSLLVREYSAQIDFIPIDSKSLLWLPLNREHISLATYYRLVMANVLPRSVLKVIYIDADVLVIEPIEQLWSIDLGGMPIGACADEGGVFQTRRLRLPVEHTYFNAGVIVFDLDQIRAMDFEEQVQAIFRQYGQFITLQDQDILNILFCQKTKKIPLAWNTGNRLYQINDLEPSYTQEEGFNAAKSPNIVHFTDKIKPWSYKSLNPFTVFYWEFRDKTPWRDSSLLRLKRRLLVYFRPKLVAKERRFSRFIERKEVD